MPTFKSTTLPVRYVQADVPPVDSSGPLYFTRDENGVKTSITELQIDEVYNAGGSVIVEYTTQTPWTLVDDSEFPAPAPLDNPLAAFF